jgi:peptidoglycan biosynthesis protein MviN/MurJ (putative lipid II flippase)
MSYSETGLRRFYLTRNLSARIVYLLFVNGGFLSNILSCINEKLSFYKTGLLAFCVFVKSFWP